MVNKKVFIIAEAGVNHNGSLKLAKQLIIEAKRAGADAIKFQTFQADKLVTKEAGKADYQIRTSEKEESQYDMLHKLELSFDEFLELKQFCDKENIMFLSTAFDIECIRFLNQRINIPILKVPSGEITNYPYLRETALCGKPVMLSTGMSTLDEVGQAIKILEKYGSGKITLLHCTTDYPALLSDVNLNAMLTMKEKFNKEVGYSDHTSGFEISIAAAAMGAEIIEKHFTLDRKFEGPDHKASLEPEELSRMVKQIRNVETARGDGVKKPSEAELKNIEIVRKSIVAQKDILSGELFSEDNLAAKRPGNGISAMRWNEFIGKKATRNYRMDDLISE